MRFYRSLGPVKAMTFDLDDTLYDNQPVIARLESELQQWLVRRYPALRSVSTQQWAQLKQQVRESDDRYRHDVTLAREAQLALAFEGINLSAEACQQAVAEAMQEVHRLRNRVAIPQISLDTLARLSAKIPLVAITNGNVDLQAIGLEGYFCGVFKAGPDGRSKPEADMFLEATRLLELSPQTVLHVGDHLVSDVLGAKAAGLQAAWFNDSRQGLESHSKVRVMPDVEITRIEQLLHFI